MTADDIKATRYSTTYLSTRYEETTSTGTTPPVTTSTVGAIIGPIDRRAYHDGSSPLAGEAWNYRQPVTGYNLGCLGPVTKLRRNSSHVKPSPTFVL